MPKFIGQSMAKTKKLSDALRAEIESLWGQLEKSLEAAQESFKDQHEKALRPLFGDRARDILNHCPLIPCPNWSPEDRQALALVYVPQETSQNPADNYPKNAAYDRQLIAHAERLLEICETFLASSSK